MTVLTGNGRDMTAHGGGGVDKRNAGLNVKTIRGVGVVTSPASRKVVKQTGVESTASAGASLPEYIGKSASEVVKHSIETQHVCVGSRGRRHLIHCFVAVPLDIGDIMRGDDVSNDANEVSLHVPQTKVENMLIPLLDSRVYLIIDSDVECPLWVRLVNLACRVTVLWLYPETESHRVP